MVSAQIAEGLLKLIGHPCFVSWRKPGFVSHSQANRIALSHNRFPDTFATVAWVPKTVEPRRFDVIHALIKSVANEVGIPGSLRTKADGRKRKTRLPQPTQLRLSDCASIVRWWLRNRLIFFWSTAASECKHAPNSKPADFLRELPPRDLHDGITSDRTSITRKPPRPTEASV